MLTKLNIQINRKETTQETLKMPVLIFTQAKIELKPNQARLMDFQRSPKVQRN